MPLENSPLAMILDVALKTSLLFLIAVTSVNLFAAVRQRCGIVSGVWHSPQ